MEPIDSAEPTEPSEKSEPMLSTAPHEPSARTEIPEPTASTEVLDPTEATESFEAIDRPGLLEPGDLVARKVLCELQGVGDARRLTVRAGAEW